MSFYRTLLATFAAMVLASPVFADDATPASTDQSTMTSAPADSSMQQSSDAAAAKVNVNKATPKELMKVKGINTAKARALVACRKKQKGQVFASLDDIAKCKGFTKMKQDDLKAIQDQLSLE